MTNPRIGPAVRAHEMNLGRVVVLPPETRLLEAAQTMVRAGVSAVVIGAGAAVLTERDIVAAFAAGRSPTELALLAVSVDRAPVPATTTALEALASMIAGGSVELIVTDEHGDPIGSISLAEVLTTVVGDIGVTEWIRAVAPVPLSAELEVQP